MKTTRMNQFIKFGWVILWICTISCEDFVEVDAPTTQITSSTVFQNDATALAAMAGVYSKMMEDDNYYTSGSNSITTITGLSGDELVNYNITSDKIRIYTNNLTGSEIEPLWTELYSTINQTNAILEGIEQGNVSIETYKQLKGEALFVRAFCHFQLVNLFGEIPVAITTDYRINSKLERRAVLDVYEQIVEDLLAAKELLLIDFTLTEGERIRPTRAAATALLARAYLYIENWSEAEKQATEVIDNPLFEIETDLNKVFLANSREAIWQLHPVSPGYNTYDAITYILLAVPNDVALSENIMNSFDPADQRKSIWTGSVTVNGNTYFYPYKYKVRSNDEISEYLTVLRLSEMYLLRAEARAHLNNLEKATADLNVTHARAGLIPLPTTTMGTLLQAIENERRTELFCEWGHRWFDLKRTKRIDSVMPTVKSAWADKDKLYPIPPSEITNNPNLFPQNPGY